MPQPGTTARAVPHKPAIVMGSSGEVVTFQQLDERSNQGAHLFRSLGLRAGDHICIMMENNRQFLEILWAAQRSGLTFTPISTHIAREETLYILGNCNARLFIGSLACANRGEEILCEPGNVDHFFMVNGSRAGFKSWEAECAGQPVTRIEDESNGIPMVHSSGITELPKGISIAPGKEDADTPPTLMPYLARTFGFDEDTVYLSPAPLYNPAPLYFSMMTTFQGGTTVVMEQFEPEQTLKLIERYRISHSQFAPIMFSEMLTLPEALRKSYDISSIKVAIHGLTPCPADVKEGMIDWWGESLVEYYSSSEGAGMALIDPYDWPEHKGSVGKAIVGNVHIAGPDHTGLPPNEFGTA